MLLLLLLLIHTFSVLSLQLKKLRWHNKSAIDLSNANRTCGHKEVRRSTVHIMVTTRYSDQQGSKWRQKVIRLYKQWHRPISKRFIKPPCSISRVTSISSECCRLPTTSILSKQKRKNYAPPVLINKSKFLKATNCTEIRKNEIPRSIVVEALSWWSRRASQHPAVQSPVHPWKSPTNLARSPLLVALVGRKMAVVRHQIFPQNPPGSSLWFSRTGVQPFPGSSTIELPSAFAESGAYPPDRALPGSQGQWSLPLACRHPPEGHQIGARKRRAPGNTILSQPYRRRVSTDGLNREGSQLAASLEGEPGTTPAGKTLLHSYPETRFWRERARKRKRNEVQVYVTIKPKGLSQRFEESEKANRQIRCLHCCPFPKLESWKICLLGFPSKTSAGCDKYSSPFNDWGGEGM